MTLHARVQLITLLLLLFIPALSHAAPPLGACAHRGDNKVAPENTLPAFVSAANKGAHMIEFDVALTRDSQIVIMHDSTVDRTTNGKGKVADLTFTEIRALDAGSWSSQKFAGTQVPTLEEVLNVIPEPILCNVHVKGGEKLAEETTRIIKRMNRVAQCVLATESAPAKAALAIAPDLRICNMDRQGNDHLAYANATVAANAQFIQMLGKEDALPEAIALCRAHNINVNFYHAETPEKIRRLANLGINYILTDDLDTCLKVLKTDFAIDPAK